MDPRRRKRLVERLRQVAKQEEAAGAKVVAEDFRRRANAVDAGKRMDCKRRKWLVERLRQVAKQEEAAGANAVAEHFRRRANEVEAGKDALDE